MSKYGNCGNTEKLAVFMHTLRTFINDQKVSSWHKTPMYDYMVFTEETAPGCKHTYKIDAESAEKIRIDTMDIYLADERLCSWWDLVKCACVTVL